MLPLAVSGTAICPTNRARRKAYCNRNTMETNHEFPPQTRRLPATSALGPQRRHFLKAGVSAVVMPWVVPCSVFGDFAPSNRIHAGIIGCGNQSTIDLPAFLGHDECQVIAVCDVNRGSHGYRTPDQFLGREPARELVNAFYATKNRSGAYHGCEAYNDFRDVLRRKDIDVVAVIVPDHWHALIAIAAVREGKDVYCEKPLSLCVKQGQAMVEAVRNTDEFFRRAACIAPARPTASPANWSAMAGSAGYGGLLPRWPSRTRSTPARAGSPCPCRTVSITACGSALHQGSLS